MREISEKPVRIDYHQQIEIPEVALGLFAIAGAAVRARRGGQLPQISFDGTETGGGKTPLPVRN